jgi:integrase
MMAKSPFQAPHHFIFSSADPGKPMSHKKIDTDFARALKAIGISEEERKSRHLSFHSWRHWANSFLVNQGLPPLRAQQVIGHTSLKMTQNYLHPGEDFSDVLTITSPLFVKKDKRK